MATRGAAAQPAHNIAIVSSQRINSIIKQFSKSAGHENSQNQRLAKFSIGPSYFCCNKYWLTDLMQVRFTSGVFCTLLPQQFGATTDLVLLFLCLAFCLHSVNWVNVQTVSLFTLGCVVCSAIITLHLCLSQSVMGSEENNAVYRSISHYYA